MFALANLYDHQDFPDRAEDLYKQILQSQPLALEAALRLRLQAIQQEDWQKALSMQEYMETEFPEVDADPDEKKWVTGIRFSLAQSEYEQNDLKTSLALLKSLIRQSPGFVPAYLLSGEVLSKLDDGPAALKIWDRGFRVTSSPALLQRIAEYYLAQNLPEQAIEYCFKAIRTQPEKKELEYCLGDLYLKMEMTNEALKVFERIRNADPDLPLIRYVLAGIYRRLGQTETAAGMYSVLIEEGKASHVLPWICTVCGNSTKTTLASVKNALNGIL